MDHTTQRRNERPQEEGRRDNQRRPGFKRPTVPGADRLTDEQEQCVKSIHRDLKSMSYDYSFGDCKQLMIEYDFNKDRAMNAVIDNKFKPWKIENANTRYGGHERSRQRTVQFLFTDADAVKKEAETYNAPIDVITFDEAPKQTERFVEYVETEKEKEIRLQREAEKQQKRDVKKQEKKEKKQIQKKEDTPKEVVEAVYHTIEIEEVPEKAPIEPIAVKPAQPVIVKPAQPVVEVVEQVKKPAQVEPVKQQVAEPAPKQVANVPVAQPAPIPEPVQAKPVVQQPAQQPMQQPMPYMQQPMQPMPQPGMPQPGMQMPYQQMPYFWGYPYMQGMMPQMQQMQQVPQGQMPHPPMNMGPMPGMPMPYFQPFAPGAAPPAAGCPPFFVPPFMAGMMPPQPPAQQVQPGK